MKKLLFFCIAGSILLFNIIVINISPAITLGFSDWSYESCSYYSDKYEYDEKKDLTNYHNSQEEKDQLLYEDKRDKTKCEKKKAMVLLEYTALNINIFFGFICAFLGFFYCFRLGNVSIIAGFAGLGTGIIGFVLTLAYVIESGLVFNDNVDRSSMRIDSDGAFLEWNIKKNHYICIFYERDEYDSIFLRYSDYGNKYLNYFKDIRPEENNYRYEQCQISEVSYQYCKNADEKQYDEDYLKYYNSQGQEFGCDKLVYYHNNNDNYYKNIYNRWLTTLILCCFILILDIGLAIIGFLIFYESK